MKDQKVTLRELHTSDTLGCVGGELGRVQSVVYFMRVQIETRFIDEKFESVMGECVI